MLRAKLLKNTRNSPRAARRKYLLAGGMRCGNCQALLSGHARNDQDTYSYRCKECRVVNINGEAVDRYVTAKMLDRLDRLIELRRGNPESAKRRKEINAELETLGERRALIGEMVAVGEMDRIAAVRGKAKLDDTQQALLRELAELPADDGLPDPDMVRHAWEHLDIAEQRKIIGRCIDHIAVAPPKTAARKLDLSRVTIHGLGWEDDQAAPPPGAVAASWRPEPNDLTDQEWDLIAGLLTPTGRGKRKGRSAKHDLRTLVDAALYRASSGCWWRDLPDRYPPHKTVARFYQEWVRTGTWTAICARLEAHAKGDPIPAGPHGETRWRVLPSDVTDDEWALVADLVAPPDRGRRGSRGRPFKYDLRQVLNGVLYREATGCVWHDLPDRYPPHRSVDRFYHQWLRDGTWPHIRQRLEVGTAVKTSAA